MPIILHVFGRFESDEALREFSEAAMADDAGLAGGIGFSTASEIHDHVVEAVSSGTPLVLRHDEEDLGNLRDACESIGIAHLVVDVWTDGTVYCCTLFDRTIPPGRFEFAGRPDSPGISLATLKAMARGCDEALVAEVRSRIDLGGRLAEMIANPPSFAPGVGMAPASPHV
jgi:hypothetical protein